MTIRTAKGTFTATTFARLAAWQAEMQGAFAAIEIGNYSVDVSDVDDTSEDNAEDYADRVGSDPEIVVAIESLRAEAATAGDDQQVALCDRALGGDALALEDCCAALCAAADACD